MAFVGALLAEVGIVAEEVAGEALIMGIEEVTVEVAEVVESSTIISDTIGEVFTTEFESAFAEVETTEIADTLNTEIREILSSDIQAEIEATEAETEAVGKEIEATAEEIEAATTSTTSSSKLIVKTIAKWTERVLVAYGVLDIVGRKIDQWIHADHSAESQLNPRQKAELQSLLDATKTLKQILQSWKRSFEQLKDPSVDLGTIQVEKRGRRFEMLTTDTVDSLLARTQNELSRLEQLDTSNQPDDKLIAVVYVGLFKSILPLDALCYLKTSGMSQGLRLYDFPLDADCRQISEMLQRDFDMEEKETSMKNNAKTLITDVVTKNAKAAGLEAAAQFLKPKIEPIVANDVKTKYTRVATAKANEVATAAAERVIQSYRWEMVGFSFIPIYGVIKCYQLREQAKKEATTAAKQAARNAISDYFASDEIKHFIKDDIKMMVSHFGEVCRCDMISAAKQGMSDVFKRALNNEI